MSKSATNDLAHGLADDLRDVADDLRGIVETVVVPKVGSAVHAAGDRVPDNVVDRLPSKVAEHLPTTRKSHRGRKLLFLGALMALGGAIFAYGRRQSSSGQPSSGQSEESYPRPVGDLDDQASPTDALDDPITDPGRQN
ncbi:hypothetical protein L615_003700000080 [Nocardioides sp. J9]|uniref:hypothetical protein n=1 Tax=Nocardioides sp. J9 TaxID=935844 RepID=UPI0011A52E3C|nr:hypothetical protein [Nocardioides sp. J9]TWG97242.1 hypothetical protein L615_003700000080 [Nocardioides sp. J9]